MTCCFGIHTWETRKERQWETRRAPWLPVVDVSRETHMDLQISGDIILLQLGSAHVAVHFIIPLSTTSFYHV